MLAWGYLLNFQKIKQIDMPCSFNTLWHRNPPHGKPDTVAVVGNAYQGQIGHTTAQICQKNVWKLKNYCHLW